MLVEILQDYHGQVYTLKPAKNSNFTYSYPVKDVFKQPQNILEEIGELFKNIGRKLTQGI